MKSLSILVLFLFVFCSIKWLNANSEPLSYSFRDITTPVVYNPKIKKIVIISNNRVGSTLLYMIFQYLFENTLAPHESLKKKVIKSHNPKENLLYQPGTYIVLPIRNPYDSFCSYVKALEKFTREEALELLNTMIQVHLDLKNLYEKANSRNLMLLRYEEFYNDFSKIFSAIEQQYNVTIPIEEKEKIQKYFNKESIIEFSKDFNHFDQRDSVTGIHGNHISKDKRTLQEIFSAETLQEIDSKLRPIANYWGY